MDRIEIDQTRLSIRTMISSIDNYPTTFVCYDHVPLWSTIVELEDLDIFLYDPTKLRDQGHEEEPYHLACRDNHGDLFVYGRWMTLKEAQDWLDSPRLLY